MKAVGRAAAAVALVALLIAGPRAGATVAGDVGLGPGADHCLLSTRTILTKASEYQLETSRGSALAQLVGDRSAEADRLKHTAASLQKLAVGVVEGTEALSETQREVLKDIRQEMDQISESTDTDHKENQDQVDRARDNLVACDTAISGSEAAASTSSSEESAHATCRTEEEQLLATKEASCAAYESACSSLNAPSCMQNLASLQEGSEFDTIQECVAQISTWSSPTNASLTEKRAACAKDREAYERKIETCGRAQGSFEMAFCNYRTALTGGCSNYTQCRSSREAEQRQLHEEVRVAEKGRKSSSVAVQLIKCFLGVIEASAEEQPQRLEACRGTDEFSTSHLNIAYHEAAPAQECDTSPVENYPCHQEWLADRYQKQPWYSKAPTTACIACKLAGSAATSTSTPTQEAAPTLALVISDVVSSGASNAAVEVEEVTGETVKYATNRGAYVLNHLGSLQSSKFIRGDNDKSTGDQSFKVNVPVTVVVAMMDGTDHAALVPEGFSATGESIGWDAGSSTNADSTMSLYAKDFDAGLVKFQFRGTSMAGIFVM